MDTAVGGIAPFVCDALPRRVWFGPHCGWQKLNPEVKRLQAQRVLPIVGAHERAVAKERVASLADKHVATFDRGRAHVPAEPRSVRCGPGRRYTLWAVEPMPYPTRHSVLRDARPLRGTRPRSSRIAAAVGQNSRAGHARTMFRPAAPMARVPTPSRCCWSLAINFGHAVC